MGKRELVLIAAFVLLGVAVYQFTAPPADPSQQGFSFGRMIQNARRTIGANNMRATVESARTEAVSTEMMEVRLNLGSADLTIVGEERSDIAFALSVRSSGSDDDDAKRLAARTTLKIDRTATGLVVGLDYPREGQQQGALTIRLPKRLAVKSEAKSGRLQVSDIASLTVRGNRGDTTITNLSGDADVTQRGGNLHLSHIGTLRVNAINADTTVTGVAGAATIESTNAKLELSGLAGPLDIKSRNTDVRLHDIAAMHAPLRLDMQQGEVTIDGLRTEGRIDGRNTDIRVSLAKAVTLAISNTNDEISVTLPTGGFTIDAIATDGELTSDDPVVSITGADREKRAAGAIRGGGPTLTLRSTSGRIALRRSDGK